MVLRRLGIDSGSVVYKASALSSVLNKSSVLTPDFLLVVLHLSD